MRETGTVAGETVTKLTANAVRETFKREAEPDEAKGEFTPEQQAAIHGVYVAFSRVMPKDYEEVARPFVDAITDPVVRDFAQAWYDAGIKAREEARAKN